MNRADNQAPAAAPLPTFSDFVDAVRDWRHIVSGAVPRNGLCEFVRYAIASAVALAGDFATLVVLTELFGVHYLTSAALGFGVGILITYVISVRWAFANRRLASAIVERSIFIAIGLGGLAINQAVMYGLTEIVLLPYAVSKFGSVGLVFTFNFVLRKLLLFTASPAIEGEPTS